MEIINLDSNFEKLINSVDIITANKILWSIDLLKELNYQLRMPYCKKIMMNLFELRICGKTEVRLFYLFHNQKIIIIYSFIKKTKKIPKHELRKVLNKIKDLI